MQALQAVIYINASIQKAPFFDRPGGKAKPRIFND